MLLSFNYVLDLEREKHCLTAAFQFQEKIAMWKTKHITTKILTSLICPLLAKWTKSTKYPIKPRHTGDEVHVTKVKIQSAKRGTPKSIWHFPFTLELCLAHWRRHDCNCSPCACIDNMNKIKRKYQIDLGVWSPFCALRLKIPYILLIIVFHLWWSTSLIHNYNSSRWDVVTYCINLAHEHFCKLIHLRELAANLDQEVDNCSVASALWHSVTSSISQGQALTPVPHTHRTSVCVWVLTCEESYDMTWHNALLFPQLNLKGVVLKFWNIYLFALFLRLKRQHGYHSHAYAKYAAYMLGILA